MTQHAETANLALCSVEESPAGLRPSREVRPIPAPRFTLVAEDRQLAAGLLAQIRKATQAAAEIHTYESVRAAMERDREDTLVLIVAAGPQVEMARLLIQEVCLRKLPLIVVVLDTAQGANEAVLELEAHVSHLLFWPRDAVTLAQVLKSRSAGRHGGDLARFPEHSSERQIAHRLLSFTPSLLPLVEKLALAAQHDVTVLLTGETGTGKTFLARLIHDFSPRRAERFLAVPCGALSPNLIESEFFGHVKGAFTGADRAKIGKFAAAGKGSLLLDEIDALPLEQQANLLRVVETGEFEPIGSTETEKAQCRLIVASNWNLKEEVEKGKFRQDLYYRFNVMSFHLPPLRERVQDIAPLVRGMAAKFNTKFRKGLFDIGSDAMAALESYGWPGNIRELENAVQHAVLVSQGPLLLVKHLPEPIQRSVVNGQASAKPVSTDSLVHNREVIERNVIQRALANHNNSRSRAASELGISRVTLYKKMKKYGLLRETPQPTAS